MDHNITLQEARDKYKNFMIIKQGCPFCHRAHEILKNEEQKTKEFDHEKYKTLTKQAQDEYKHYTYPLIILDGEFIGGCSDLEKKK